jgi:hypothetical protein
MRTSWAALAGTATADTAATAARIANFFMGRLQIFKNKHGSLNCRAVFHPGIKGECRNGLNGRYPFNYHCDISPRV